MNRLIATVLMSLLVLICGAVGTPRRGEAQEVAAEADPAVLEGTSQAAPGPVVSEPELRPRFELRVGSVRRLISEIRRAHSNFLVEYAVGIIVESARGSSEAVDTDAAAAAIDLIKGWPDTGVDAYTFASDTEGRRRWAVRLDWPIRDLHARVEALLTSQAAEEILEGVRVRSVAQSGYELTLSGRTLAFLLPGGESHAVLASHADLTLPPAQVPEGPEAQEDQSLLLNCTLHLTATEKDSGATFLSSFSAVTGVAYACSLDDKGDWSETANLYWPPISGMGAKVFFGRVKQTFMIPEDAFGAMVFNAIVVPGMLEGIAGFGPQMMMEQPGEVEMVGATQVGPLANRVGSEMCLTVLPGTGFLPAPDIVVQTRVKSPERLIDDLREATQEINRLYRYREQSEPWHEVRVRERPVFFSDGSTQYRGMVMPMVLRPVLFVTREMDARKRERDFLVIGWTSTSPERFVRRWVDLPRVEHSRFLPTKRKTNGQMWINWRQTYKWLHPYVNVGLSIAASNTFLPHPRDVAAELTDALTTVKMKYSGIALTHGGPVPMGALIVPAMLSASTAMDYEGGSDLARERLACQRLKVMYHHAKLFKKDLGRWPAEVGELDGYVDFAGHPELLELKLSSRNRWDHWFSDLLDSGEDDDTEDEDEEEEEHGAIDDDLYVIDWGRKQWTLGYAPGTLEHLEKLYIDQDGDIHRVQKVPGDDEQGSGKTSDAVDTGGFPPPKSSIHEGTAHNLTGRYTR